MGNPQNIPLGQLLDEAERLIGEVAATLRALYLHRLAADTANDLSGRRMAEQHFAWVPIRNAMQSFVTMGIFALTEPRKPANASADTIIRRASSLPGVPAKKLKELLVELGAIHGRCERFRHKVFGHADAYRGSYIQAFVGEDVPLDQTVKELSQIEFAVRAVREVSEGRSWPSSLGELSSREYQDWPANVEEHTKLVLQDLKLAYRLERGFKPMEGAAPSE